MASLRRENNSLDTELHDKERVVSQLQLRVSQLEQGVSDKDQLLGRTREVLESTQQQKVREWRQVKAVCIGNDAPMRVGADVLVSFDRLKHVQDFTGDRTPLQ